MKNLFKKISALVLAAIMVLSMCTAVFATGTTPTAADKKEATVNNVEATATVNAYQITKAKYDNGFTGYEAVQGVTLANVLAPTSDEVTAIAKNAALLGTLPKKTMTKTTTEGLASFKAELNPGYWVVIVSGTVEEVYNPMLIGVYYSVSGSDSTMTSDPVNANSNWTLVTANAYAKSTKPSIKKTIVGGEAEKHNDVAIGDTVSYKIETAIPSYSKQYKSATVKITDTLSKGLTLKEETIKINNKIASEVADMGTLEPSTNGFVFTVNSNYALEHGGDAITITYDAEVNKDAEVNFDPNTNTATLEYTNNPNGTTKETESETYTYTFAIGAALSQSITNFNQKVNQIVKVDSDGKVISTKKEISDAEKDTVIQVGKGATFKLTNDKKEYTATTVEDGGLTFTGLDAGTYTLVETVAPEGFTLDTTPHTVVITPTYGENNKLTKLEITIDTEATSTYEVTYEKTGETKVTTNTTKVTNIANTRLSSLPSTGGMGTYLFTIVGVVLMTCAAGAFFVSRRKTNK